MFGCVICMACVAAAAKGGDQLYSRQLLTFGRGAQEKIMAGRVLVFGADGVGAVCKNLALAGVASITVAGDARARAAADLGAHFYASPSRTARLGVCAGAEFFVFDDFGDGFRAVGRELREPAAPPRAAPARRRRAAAAGGSAAEPAPRTAAAGDAAGTVVVATAGGERHDAAEGDALVLRSGARGVAAATLAVRPLAAVLAARAGACVDGGWPDEPDSLVVFGAGATGCEILKNLALLGVRRVLVADDDAIEVSNLSRQFLYRPGDIGANKATTAAAAARRFNDDVDVVAPRPRGTRSFDARRRARPGRRPSAAFRERDGGTSLVEPQPTPSMRPSSSVATFGLGVPLRLDAGSRTASTRRPSARPGVDPAALARRQRGAAGDIFDDDFWAGVDLVFTALDSVEARLFVDGICVARTLPLVDCGTLGAAGSVQPAVPCAPGADAGRRRNPAPRSPWGAPPPARGATARGLGRRAPASPRHVTESYGATADRARPAAPGPRPRLHAQASPVAAAAAGQGLGSSARQLRCKQIAGKVVPAIATTTAVVSGLAVFEAAKILAGLGGVVPRSAFVHLGARSGARPSRGP
ncbi:ubiquitin activating enzyme [Aureococcus anophagefferens]|nr:ubiquitin activating enzyme [Aureococcus anophagefferens]